MQAWISLGKLAPKVFRSKWKFLSSGVWWCVNAWVFPDAMKDHGPFVFKSQVVQEELALCLSVDVEGAVILWNVRSRLPSDPASHTEDLNCQPHCCENLLQHFTNIHYCVPVVTCVLNLCRLFGRWVYKICPAVTRYCLQDLILWLLHGTLVCS